MRFHKIIPYICFILPFLATCNHADAENMIERSAEYIENIQDTLYISNTGYMSNIGHKNLEVGFIIQAKGIALEIYSVEVCINHSIYEPTVPFTLNIDEAETADSLITWHCILRFPYRSNFLDSDTWTVNTSCGKFSGKLRPEPHHTAKRPFWIKYWRQIPLAITILSCLIIACTIIYYRKRRKKDIEERLYIMHQFESNEQAHTELREKVETLYAERWNVFNRLCNEYFDKKDSDSDTVRLSIYKEVERQINDMRSTKSLAELENLVDVYNNNLIQRLRAQLPTLTKNDITFLIYLYSGFSPRAICLFTNIKIKNFYNRKTRLKDKILESGAEDREEFASKM